MEKIGIIGTGNMGRAVGSRLAQVGHDVFFGARNEQQAVEAAKGSGTNARAGSIASAAQFGDLLLWTMREPDPTKVVKDPALLHGKIIMDLNNRDYAVEAKSGAWFERAIAERLQENLPMAEVVKVFNTLAMEAFDLSPTDLRASGATTFLAGRSAAAKERVTRVAESLGLAPVDLGDSSAAMRAAEALGDVIRLLMIDGKAGVRAHLRLVELKGEPMGKIGQRLASNYA